MYPAGFEFNLQRQAMLTIGRSVWQHPKVLFKIDNWFFWSFAPITEWHEFTREHILDKIRKQAPLPDHLQRELLHVVKSMGNELLDWLTHVKRMNNIYYRVLSRFYWESIECPSSIHWTSYGTIDVRKTVEESWVKNPPEQLCPVYHMAVCSGVDEQQVHKLWNSMSRQQRYIYMGIYNEEYAVHAYYENHRDKKLEELRKDIENNGGSYRLPVSYDHHLTFEENMFLTFVSEGYAEAAKLIWQRLDELARDRVIEKAAEISLDTWRRPVRNYDDFMARQWADLSIFLISRLTSEQKMMFLGKSSDVLRMVAQTWPWNEFFTQVFDELRGYFGNDGGYDSILFDIANRLITEDAKFGYVTEGSKNQELFQKCWKRLSSKEKLECGLRLTLTVPMLIEPRDMTSAQMILNSPEVAAKKSVMLEFSHHLFESMIEKNQFPLLEKFIDNNFKTDRDKKNFKQSLLPHTKFILRGRFDLAEKCLDWQCRTEKEKDAVKMAIDYRQIWEGNPYIRKRYAAKFLNWQCSSLEKRRTTKNNLACEFTRDTIYKLWVKWKTNVRKGEKKAIDFFEWFMKLEEEIEEFRYKRNITDEMIVLLVEAILNQNYFDIVDNLQHWCSLTVIEVKEVRRKILTSSKVPICRHCIEAGELQISHGFLQWIEDDTEKKKFVNHFVSNKGSTSCYVFIANERSLLSKKKSKFRDFINYWVRPLDHDKLCQFKKGVNFQAKRSKYKQPKDGKNYEIFQILLNELT